MADQMTTLHPPNINTQPNNIDTLQDEQKKDAIEKPRKSNRIYFTFYFFLWMFIGSLWILPPLLFHKISSQCNLSLTEASLLFCLYYICNGISSLFSTFIINSNYFVKTHLLTAILILICIISLQFMPSTNSYFYQSVLWIIVSIVDGYINNAAPVYIYRIYHIEASVMLTLCTLIASFIMIIISMSIVNQESYQSTINFITFFGCITFLGLIALKTPTQKQLIKTVKQARTEIIGKKLETIVDHKDYTTSRALVINETTDGNDGNDGREDQLQDVQKWYSMKNSILFNNRSSMSATISTYFHQYAPEISFNPSVINTIRSANRDSHIQYPINAMIQASPRSTHSRKLKIKTRVSTTNNLQLNSPSQTATNYTKTDNKQRQSLLRRSTTENINVKRQISANTSAQSTPNTFNTFASSNVRKIIAFSTNPPILSHSANESTCITLELIWKEINEEEKQQKQPQGQETPLPDMTPIDDPNDNTSIHVQQIYEEKNNDILQQIEETQMDDTIDKRIAPQLRIYAQSNSNSHKKAQDPELTEKEKELMVYKMKKQLSAQSSVMVSQFSGGNITDYTSATNTPVITPTTRSPQKKSTRRVLFSENILQENASEDFMSDNFDGMYSNKTSMNFPSTTRKTDDGYWFDIEKRLESFSLMSKRADTALASYVYNNQNETVHSLQNVSSVYNNYNEQARRSDTFSNDNEYEVTLNRMSRTVKSYMQPINETKEQTSSNNNNNNKQYIAHINDRPQLPQQNKYNNNNKIGKEKENVEDVYLKKSKQTLFVYIVLITMIYSASRICYLTFITIYILDFVGGKEFVAIWLITIYCFGHFISRIIIIFMLKKYSSKNILLVCQFFMLLNCMILLMVDWLHIGKPIENKQSRKFTKIMLYLILFIAGLTSSPIYIVSFAFLNKIQKVTQFLSTISNIANSISNAISLILMALIISKFGIATFPYYIMLILFVGFIIVIVLNIKFMLYQHRLRLTH